MRFVLLIMFLFCFRISEAQKILEINYFSLFGKNKSFQFFSNSEIDYKLKGDFFYRTHKIVNMQDSMLIFDNDSAVKLDQLKAIKIRGMKLSHWILVAGLGFFIIDTGNNIANNHSTLVNQQTIVFASTCLVLGIIAKHFQDKHVQIRKNCTLRILDINFQNLNK